MNRKSPCLLLWRYTVTILARPSMVWAVASMKPCQQPSEMCYKVNMADSAKIVREALTCYVV